MLLLLPETGLFEDVVLPLVAGEVGMDTEVELLWTGKVEDVVPVLEADGEVETGVLLVGVLDELPEVELGEAGPLLLLLLLVPGDPELEVVGRV
jgi:hypothetical protein